MSEQQQQPNEKTKLKSYQNVHHISFEDDDDDNQYDSFNQSSSHHILFFRPIIVLAIAVFALYILHQNFIPVPAHHHDHTIPTLLSIRSNELSQDKNAQGKLLNSLDNVIYNILKEADFDEGEEEDSSSADVPSKKAVQYTIQSDKNEISFHENLTIEWEIHNTGKGDVGNGDQVGDMKILNSDHNVVALYCPANESNPKKFKDAATISQIRVTNKYNGQLTDYKITKGQPAGDNITPSSQAKLFPHNRKRNIMEEMTIDRQWIIPSFPLIKEDTCAFKLWIRGHNDYHADEMGKQISRYTLGASTGPIRIKNGMTQPTTIHLAFTTDPSEMMVQFSTGAEGTPIVVFHEDENVVTGGDVSAGLHINQGESTTYKADDMCQKPAITEEPGKFSSPGMLHSVVMSDLDSNTKYYYKVGILRKDDDKYDSETLPSNIIWSDVKAFKSPITSQDEQQQFSFVVYADQGAMGYGNDDGGDRTSQMEQREVQLNDIRSVHHIGDLSYAQGVGHMWDKWLDMVSVFSGNVPLMIGVGNHEYDHTSGGGNGKDPSGIKTPGGFSPHWGDFGDDSNGECGIPVSKRFKMPANGNGVFWYSYTYGNVQTIILSSEHDLSRKSVQYKWLENELASVNRTSTPWVLVEAHRPMYNNENVPANTKVGIGMRNEFEHLLHKYNVDLFLSGHYHAYMRSCSGLYKGKCDNGGPIHITVGTAGAELDNVPVLRVDWAAKYIVEWGYARVTSVSNNELKWQFVSDQDGSVKDEITLKK